MNKYIVKLTDGSSELVEADGIFNDNGTIVFYENQETGEFGEAVQRYVCCYSLQNMISVRTDKTEITSKPKPEKNEDLISRSAILAYLNKHWTVNIIDLLKEFPAYEPEEEDDENN